MKKLLLCLLFLPLVAFSATLTRTFDRQIPEDRKLQLNQLTVSGPVITAVNTQSGTTFDFSQASVIKCTSCGATTGAVSITLTNIQEGSFYTLNMLDSSTATHTFIHTGLTVLYNPVQAPRATGKIASYIFHRVDNKLLVTLSEF